MFIAALTKPSKPTSDYNFVSVAERQGSTLVIDFENKVAWVKWLGVVEEDTAAYLLTVGADAVANETCNKILLDRSNLIEFETGARVWIKYDFLKTRAVDLASSITHLATVNPESSGGSIFANFITSGIELLFPKLNIRRCQNVTEALNWFY